MEGDSRVSGVCQESGECHPFLVKAQHHWIKWMVRISTTRLSNALQVKGSMAQGDFNQIVYDGSKRQEPSEEMMYDGSSHATPLASQRRQLNPKHRTVSKMAPPKLANDSFLSRSKIEGMR